MLTTFKNVSLPYLTSLHNRDSGSVLLTNQHNTIAIKILIYQLYKEHCRVPLLYSTYPMFFSSHNHFWKNIFFDKWPHSIMDNHYFRLLEELAGKFILCKYFQSIENWPVTSYSTFYYRNSSVAVFFNDRLHCSNLSRWHHHNNVRYPTYPRRNSTKTEKVDMND